MARGVTIVGYCIVNEQPPLSIQNTEIVIFSFKARENACFHRLVIITDVNTLKIIFVP